MKRALFLLLSFFVSQLLYAEDYNTYFRYSYEELKELAEMSSNLEMSNHELMEWDKISRQQMAKEPLPEDFLRFFAYYYTAQRDAGFLSFDTHQKFVGSLAPISWEVIKLFYPSFSQEKPKTDAYSEKLAGIVIKKIKERYTLDQENKKEMALKESETTWEGKKPYYGLSMASWHPWLLSSYSIYRAPPPPPETDTAFWKAQVEAVKKNHDALTENQKEQIHFWAGEMGPESGEWRSIVNAYMFENKVSFAKVLLVRSVLGMAFCDASGAIFESKYTYLVKRPHMRDKTIKTTVDCPNHPSYPSGHSTTSEMSAVLLTYYFPDQKKEWDYLAEEAGLSRIWAGIHYPIDHQVGQAMGKKLAEAILQNPASHLD